ncbi:MAG: DNA polymerase III subunit gamma/tau [Rhodospirillales bacterium]|nr:DNA polymerase III subunit gamma/tau [Rhodospirillales bacterium]
MPPADDHPSETLSQADPALAGPTLELGLGASGAPSAGYRVLARKYRPAIFADLIGQEAMVRTLTNALASGRLAHAFMLSGVRGIGKTTTARIIARALNCIGADGNGGPTASPCGVCQHCTAIAADRHMDVIEMDAASRTGVDEIRELLDGVRYRPTSARYKIYIIDEVHMLSRNAFNALLKTLEEPPEHVRFVFATTEIRKVPITVLSRCQRFDLRRIDQERLARHLADIAGREGAGVDPAALHLLARAADGSVRDALSLLDQAIAHAGGSVDDETVRRMLGLADRTVTYDLADALLRGAIAEALALVAAQYRAGADPVEMLGDLLDLTHWCTRIKVDPACLEAPGVAEAERVRGREIAERLSMAEATRLWQMLLKGLGEVRTAPAPLQAAEMVLIRIAYASRLPTPAEALSGAKPVPAAAGSARAAGAAAGSGAPAAGSGSPAAAARPEPSAPSQGPAVTTTMAAAAPAALAVAPAVRAETEREPPAGPGAAAAAGRSIQSFAAVVDLAREEREAILYGHLVADVHLVHFAPPRIEIRLSDGASGDLVRRLREFLGRQTGQPWLVTVSHEAGEPTLLEQRRRLEAERRLEVAADPLVQAVLAAFPGARLGEIHTAAPAAAADVAGGGGDDDVADDEQPAEADGEDMAAEDDVRLDD